MVSRRALRHEATFKPPRHRARFLGPGEAYSVTTYDRLLINSSGDHLLINSSGDKLRIS